uniref:Uncharacterized protein n=1 Tax=Leersia perrieri TaxID=77586 RepID=A0A0D9V801_9ORYZ
MPKIKTSRVKYPKGWELIEPTIRELDAKMREAENDTHDGKRKCEALWPIFRISHQRSRYIYDLYYRRKEISKELYEFCLDQGHADRNLIAKWKKPGYERLCCLRCIQTRDHNFATTCVCRVPKHLREEKVAELEEQVQAVTAERRQAEWAATEVLAILESQGFGGHLSDVLDSGSDRDGEEENDDHYHDPRPRDARRGGDTGGEEKAAAAAAAQGEAEDAMSGTAQPGNGLSWKGRSVSPRKARQLKQKHRRSYFYLLSSSDSSPKYRMGQSCRKNKRKELRSAAQEEEGGDVAELAGSQKGQQDGSDCTDDGQHDMDGGQYVIKYEKDGEMERMLERQAELIGQYEAEEEAQRQWEEQYNENQSATKVHVVVKNKACKIENGREQSKHDRLDDQAVHCNQGAKSNVKSIGNAISNRSAGHLSNGSLPESPQNASGQQPAADQRDAHEVHHGHCGTQSQGSSNGVDAVTMQNQGDENPNECSSYCAIKAPSDGSPSTSDATPNSKVSDWSSSRFHDHGDSQLGTQTDQQPRSNMDIESVLQALQLARISLSQKLSKPVPPSQVTLALPAPGDDEQHTEEDGYSPADDEFNSARDELCSSSPSLHEILALPAPEDYHERGDLPVSGATISQTDEQASLSPHQQEILALPAPGDDCHSEIVDDIKIPICTAGLFRLPTDSFPKDEMLSSCSKYGSELNLRPTATTRQNAFAGNTAARETIAPSVLRDDHILPAKQCYDPQSSVLFSVPTSGRCSTPGSDFTIGGASFHSGIPGLAEDFRKGRTLSDADLFMQRGCDYAISNKWML